MRAIFNLTFFGVFSKNRAPPPPESFIVLFITRKVSMIILIEEEGCALAEPGAPCA